MKTGLIVGGIVGVIVVIGAFFIFYNNNDNVTGGAVAKPIAEVYLSPTCGCCAQYAGYLADKGFNVKSVKMGNLDEMKNNLGIPKSMQTCHTVKIGDYFVEGHVPIEAIQKLLTEKPEIDGIVLPGMPSGSPGMTGVKTQPFVVYSVSEGSTTEFVTI